MPSTLLVKYARSLLEVAAERKEERRVLEDLSSFVQLFRSHSLLRETLCNPALPFSSRRKIVEEVGGTLGLARTALNFLLVLLHRGRISQLEQALEAYQEVLDEREGILRVQVRTSRPLSPELRGKLEQAVSMRTGARIKMEHQVEESLIGGLKVQVGSTVYDGSIRTQLEEIRRRMTG